jgi:DNA-binding transcriptional ArsR family regulator
MKLVDDRAMDPARVEETARILRCLGHPVRLLILDLLQRDGELTVTEIWETLGLEQAVCSQHLTLMRDKGILGYRKDGVNAFYRIGDERAFKVLGCIRGQIGGEAASS